MTGSIHQIPNPAAIAVRNLNVAWVEYFDGRWRAWTGLSTIRHSEVWASPADASREYTLVAEVPCGRSWPAGAQAIADAIWPINGGDRREAGPYSRRNIFLRDAKRVKVRSATRFGELPHLRRSGDVARLEQLVLTGTSHRSVMDALQVVGLLAAEDSSDAEQLLWRTLEHPDFRLRCEAVEVLSFVRAWHFKRANPSLGPRVAQRIDNWVFFQRMPVNWVSPGAEGGVRQVVPWLPFKDVLERALADEDPNVRCVGLRYALATHLPPGKGLSMLREAAVSDPSPLVRAFAFNVLRFKDDPDIVALMVAQASDPDEKVRSNVLPALSKCMDPAVFEPLLHVFANATPTSDGLFRAALAELLTRPGMTRAQREKVERLLLTIANHPGWRLTTLVPWALAEWETPATLTAYRALVADPEAGVQAALAAREEEILRAEREQAEQEYYDSFLCDPDDDA